MSASQPDGLQQAIAAFRELVQPAILVAGEKVVEISSEAKYLFPIPQHRDQDLALESLIGEQLAARVLAANSGFPTSFPLTLNPSGNLPRKAALIRVSLPGPDTFILLLSVEHRSLLDIISNEYRSLLDTVPDLVIVHDHLGSILFANSTTTEVLGIPAEHLVGSNVMDLLSPEEAVAARQRGLQRVAHQDDKFFGYQLRRETSDGEPIDLDIRSMPFWEEGPHNLILLVGKNTGQAEVRQGRLDTARRRAEADSASKSAVLAQTSHEIRTPLNIVFGMIDMALDQDLPEEAGSYLTVARSAARTLLSLLDDFLEFSKLESGKLTLRETLFSPKEVLEEACVGLELLAAEKNLRLHLVMESALPEQLFGDPQRLRQIIGNLATNAIKYTDTGSIQVKANIASHAEEHCHLHLRIKDTGCGISPQKLPLLFQPFFQVDEDAEGSGLGLAVVKELVELLGGRVWVESVEGQGSEFHFTAEFRFSPELARSEA